MFATSRNHAPHAFLLVILVYLRAGYRNCRLFLSVLTSLLAVYGAESGTQGGPIIILLSAVAHNKWLIKTKRCLGCCFDWGGWNFVSTPSKIIPLEGAEAVESGPEVRKLSARKFPKTTPIHYFQSADDCRSTERAEMARRALGLHARTCRVQTRPNRGPNQPATNRGVRSRR